MGDERTGLMMKMMACGGNLQAFESGKEAVRYETEIMQWFR